VEDQKLNHSVTVHIAALACSPKADPAGMRVPEARMGKEILDAKEATHA